jgi:Tfp pilus assembly protein PilN
MIAEEIPFFEHLLMTDYKVSHSLLDDILNATPKNVAYSSYSVSSEAVSISGISTEYAYIAEFEYNLRALNVFEDIHVSFINGDTNTEDTLGFDIQLLFGGEDYE